MRGGTLERIQKSDVTYVHIAKAAKLLSSSEQYVRAKCASGELLGQIVGGAWYIEEYSMERYLRRHQVANEERYSLMRTRGKEDMRVAKEKSRQALPVVGCEIRLKRFRLG